ncbi:ORF6N domain-containing protein [Algoriphagus sp.]|uniref:ORF6N domain-containing protein n=1 Tax=Algoriphagus sp. TaxID=1872435 RepID=UPI00351E493F
MISNAQNLSELFGVEIKRFNELVKRSKKQFPKSFKFQLSQSELDYLRSQNATANIDSLIVTPWN